MKIDSMLFQRNQEKLLQFTSVMHVAERKLRLHGSGLRVYSVIPSHLLKEGIPHKMDAFLEPLIEEITEIYLTGIQVHIPETIELSNWSVNEGNHNVRGLLLLGTAGLKAHQEIILYAGGGLSTVY